MIRRWLVAVVPFFLACSGTSGGDGGGGADSNVSGDDAVTGDDATPTDDTGTNGEAAPIGDDAITDDGSSDGPIDAPATDAPPADAPQSDAPPPPPACGTRVTYGSAWIHPGHPNMFDDATGVVTWDGKCVDEGGSSYAVLSNGWKPYFTGSSACVIALDYTSGCSGVPTSCATRVSYGTNWMPPPAHPASYDDVADRLLWSGVCKNEGANSYGTLSNGWAPHFAGNGACALSFRYEQCGGLYQNEVFPACADPGVLKDGNRYVAVCTSGNSPNAYPILVSNDLVHWNGQGFVFPAASKPSWARSDFWAPEIHKVGNGYVAYFTARAADGKLSIGAATAPSATGPFKDIGAPLIHDPNMGLIDATEYEAPDGSKYVIWKEDGNAVGKQTPIHAQRLSASGTALAGSQFTAPTLITNDRAWEGSVVEGPWMIGHGGEYYLFYSGASYANASYAVGVAKGPSPMGPFTKLGAPILTSAGPWVGPGHCSVVPSPSGVDTYMVYHAWLTGHVNGPGDNRLMLVDRVTWAGSWPQILSGPSARSEAMP